MNMSGKMATSPDMGKKVGVLTTWNQECGLATYAQYLLSEFQPGTYTVLAEDTERARLSKDEPYVVRCWKRKESEFSKLEAAIQAQQIGVLHLNCHYSFFSQPAFAQFIERQKSRGIICIAHLHNVYQLDPEIIALVRAVDTVIVHSPESRLEVIANGAMPERVEVLRHGVQVRPALDERGRQNLRLKLRLPVGEKIILAFGFVQPHKGMEGVLEAVARLRDRGIAARGVIAGKANQDDPYSAEYVQELKRMAELLHVGDRIDVLDRYLNDTEVSDYLAAADVVLMNYRSQHYEASGACSLAIGAGAIVAASIAPPFIPFGDAVWHITSGYSAAVSAELLLVNEPLRRTIKENADRYCREFAWPRVVERLNALYQKFGFLVDIRKKELPVEQQTNSQPPRAKGRILMQMRPNAFTQRGGDTVVMDKLSEGLRALNVDVVLDPEGRQDPKGFDLVHLFNFANAELTRGFAERAKRAGVPYVVTTLYEDTPAYRNQAIALAMQLVGYVEKGQQSAWWKQHAVDVTKVTPAAKFENSWTAQHAAALFPNGEEEAKALRRDYPGCKTREVKLGHELEAKADPNAILRAYGVKDFVLCVGRFEFRKNQLMLLKALEESELTLVLASGGFSYDAEYDQAVRNFKRKGRTLIVDRLTPEMLASAYAAAKVHVLPSWYELPGLVSLEAAHQGCNVVVTELGTAVDYFGQAAFYCDPWSESSIRNAVLAAYYAPKNAELQQLARSYSWQQTVAQTIACYEEIIQSATKGAVPSVITTTTPLVPSATVTPVQESEKVIKAEDAAMAERWEEAHQLLDEALHENPKSCRGHKAKGTILLAQSQQKLARPYFERALALDPNDPRSLSGLAMCDYRDGNIEGAYQFFKRALQLDVKHLTSLLQFMECAYALQRYQDLEHFLRQYVAVRPEDIEMRFCLAGACFKSGNVKEAAAICQSVLSTKPQHQGALELQRILTSQNQNRPVEPMRTEAIASTFATPSTGTSHSVPQNASSSVETELLRLEELKRDRNVPEAAQGCQRLESAQMSPDQRERLRTLQAECEVLSDNLPKALELYAEIIAANPQSARALCGKGAISAHRGQWEEAKALFETALRFKPGYDVALAGMGLCCSWFKQHEEAWNYYMSAIKSNPENARALLGIIELGYPLKRLSDVESAVKAYLDMHPLDFEFLYAFAGCLFAQGKFQEAREEVKKITLFEPGNSRAIELERMIDEREATQGAQAQRTPVRAQFA
jgi:glycosyltransferase involved in cell wall biosynthesis/Flp pilus assembly protein TadD